MRPRRLGTTRGARETSKPAVKMQGVEDDMRSARSLAWPQGSGVAIGSEPGSPLVAEEPTPSEDRSSPTKAQPAAPAAASSVRPATAVIFVHDLDSSVNFYCGLLAMKVTVRDACAALLVSADALQVYLREVATKAPHASGCVGLQYVIWTAADNKDLRRCERFLKDCSARVQTQIVDGIAFVRGRDPSGLPVVVTYPGPDQAVRHRIMERIITSW